MRKILVAVVACCVASYAQADYKVETIAEGLNFPWSIAFLPDGSMLVTERNGGLRIIRDGELQDEPVNGVPEAFVAGQGGLFDVVPDPDYESNNALYLSFAHGKKKANATRVIRAVFDGQSLTDQKVLFTASPTKNTSHHYGGRMAFMPDGTLLLTTGEGFDFREKAQRLDNHFGKIIRINTDGSVPEDNPFVDRPDALPEIWSYGHRNPQGIVVLPDTGDVYIHEHGPRGGDELNLILPGRNYGWPAITYGIDYSGASISPYTELPGMEQPVTYWVPSIAPGGMAYFDGDLYVAALAERTVRRLSLENGTVTDQEILFEDMNERFRDVRTAPDGSLYLLTDSPEGKVLRVTP
jgi:glucose/arabinose dehydrogenase